MEDVFHLYAWYEEQVIKALRKYYSDWASAALKSAFIFALSNMVFLHVADIHITKKAILLLLTTVIAPLLVGLWCMYKNWRLYKKFFKPT